jgi:hypothetical protein
LKKVAEAESGLPSTYCAVCDVTFRYSKRHNATKRHLKKVAGAESSSRSA